MLDAAVTGPALIRAGLQRLLASESALAGARAFGD